MKSLMPGTLGGKLELTIKNNPKDKILLLLPVHSSPEYNKIEHTIIGAGFSNEGHCFSLNSGVHKMAALRRGGRCLGQLAN